MIGTRRVKNTTEMDTSTEQELTTKAKMEVQVFTSCIWYFENSPPIVTQSLTLLTVYWHRVLPGT